MNVLSSMRLTRILTLVIPSLFLVGCYGTGEGPTPIKGNPPPPVICEGIFNFEDGCGPFSFNNFESGNSVIIDNPDKGALNDTDKVAQMTKADARSYGGGSFGGTGIAVFDPIDFAQGEAFTMKVWSSRSVPVLFKLEESQFVFVEDEVEHTGGGEWQELCFDFTGAAAGLNPGSLIVIFDIDVYGEVETNPAAWTFYYDEITQVASCGAGPGPGPTQVDLPVTFDDVGIDYDLNDFGDPVSAATTLVADPTDAGNTVASTNKPVGSPVWAGTTVGNTNGLASAIPFSATETSMTVRVYSPDAAIPVRLKVEDATDPTISVETEAMTTGINTWETLTFDFSNEVAGTAALNIANTYDKVSIFFNFGTDGDTAGDKTYLWDDVAFGAGGGGGGGTSPTTSAPTPTQDAGSVISLYSDAYTDVATTWPTPWSEPAPVTVNDITVDGGLVKEHLAINFVGVEFTVDATSMTHVHFDVWTPDATSLLFRLVDFGGDGFGGGNDTQAEVTLDAASTPALAQGSWVSVDIPLQTFLDNGLASVADLNQIVLDPTDGTTVYVDNVYFYDDNASGGTGEIAINGGFETGDFTGWTQFEATVGDQTINTGVAGDTSSEGTFHLEINNTATGTNSLIKQERVGLGTVTPGIAWTVTFDARGSLDAGGVAFAQVFSETAAGNENCTGCGILGGAPLAINADSTVWTSFTFSGTAGPNTESLTLQLEAVTGSGNFANMFYDNISIVVGSGP